LQTSQNFWKKTKLPEKCKLLEKRGFELPEMRRADKDSCPQPTRIHKLSRMSMVWNISIGKLGYLSGCAPSQLLHTCSLAEQAKLEKVLDFVAITKNVSVINILLILNPKHSSH